MTGGIVEDYKVSVFRPKGMTVAEMNDFIRKALIDFAWGHPPREREIAQHPVKVSREHPEHTHRKHALID